MRIGFDVSQTGRWKAGCGYFADTLIQHLADQCQDEYVLYPTFGDGVWDPDWATATRQLREHANVQGGLGHLTFDALQDFWRKPPDDLEDRLGSPDVVHANNFFCPTTLQRARLIYTLYDLGFVAHPEWTTEANRIVCFNGVFDASLFADHIIAISRYSRQHFLEVFPHYPSQRISVVYPASRFDGPTGVPRPKALGHLNRRQFWLSVATLEPRKNHLRLLEAYTRVRAELGDCYPLVLVGGKGWLMDGLLKELDALELSRDVIYLGYVDDAHLTWLYENCFGFCYLSSFEGFGLPVIEAMSLGAPVITSNATSIPEIVGAAGTMVDPNDVDQICRAMLNLALDSGLGESLREQGLQRSAEFSWASAAAQVRRIYEESVADPRADARERPIPSLVEPGLDQLTRRQ